MASFALQYAQSQEDRKLHERVVTLVVKEMLDNKSWTCIVFGKNHMTVHAVMDMIRTELVKEPERIICTSRDKIVFGCKEMNGSKLGARHWITTANTLTTSTHLDMTKSLRDGNKFDALITVDLYAKSKLRESVIEPYVKAAGAKYHDISRAKIEFPPEVPCKIWKIPDEIAIPQTLKLIEIPAAETPNDS